MSFFCNKLIYNKLHFKKVFFCEIFSIQIGFTLTGTLICIIT
ncbi:MAG: hypothetical protein JWQ54_809 [Mucilaginibacter sp.]|nr:hypothetical protein [Mucilaginibacter sp.]